MLLRRYFGQRVVDVFLLRIEFHKEEIAHSAIQQGEDLVSVTVSEQPVHFCDQLLDYFCLVDTHFDQLSHSDHRSVLVSESIQLRLLSLDDHKFPFLALFLGHLGHCFVPLSFADFEVG